MSSIPQQYASQQQLSSAFSSTKNYSIESDEGDLEDNPLHSSSSKLSNLSEVSIDQSINVMKQQLDKETRVHQFLGKICYLFCNIKILN